MNPRNELTGTGLHVNKTVKSLPETVGTQDWARRVVVTTRTRVIRAGRRPAGEIVLNHPTVADGHSEYLWVDDMTVTRIAISEFSYCVPFEKPMATREWSEPPG